MERDEWILQQASERLLRANRALGQVRIQVLTGGSRKVANALGRDALSLFRSAMDWSEGTALFDRAHHELDLAGRYMREKFGCELHFEKGSYLQRCPVALAHTRIGLSPGYIVEDARCSICGRDPEDCTHITGRTYDGQMCVREIHSAKLVEVSFVPRPANPDARITSETLDMRDLRRQFGPSFKPGVRISCDRCLNRCLGVNEVDPNLFRRAQTAKRHRHDGG